MFGISNHWSHQLSVPTRKGSRPDIGRLDVHCGVMSVGDGYFALLSFDSSAMLALSS